MSYQISARLVLQGPTNLAQVASQINRGLAGVSIPVGVNLNPQAVSQLAQSQQQMQQTTRQSQLMGTALGVANTQLGNVNRTTVQTLRQMQQVNAAMLLTNRSLGQTGQLVRQTTSYFTRLGETAQFATQRFLAFAAGAGTLMAVVSSIRAATAAALDFERSMNKISQVSGESDAAVGAVATAISDAAAKYGVSSNELAKSSLVLAQAGITMQDVARSAQTLAAAAAAPNFESMAQTAEGMIAVMRQFKLDAEGTKNAIGAMDAVAAKFAVESRDLVTAVQKTGGAFAAAGGSVNELLGIFTSVRATTRESAQEIATGLRTILARTQRADVLEQLKAFQVELRYTADEARALGDINLTGQFVGAMEAFRRLSQVTKGMQGTDPRFASIVDSLGGYRQISRVIPLLQQFGEAEKAVGVAGAGSVSLFSNAEKSTETLYAKLGQTKEGFLALFRTIANSSSFKAFAAGALGLANSLGKILEVAQPLLPLLTAMATISITRAAIGYISNAAGNSAFTSGKSRPFGANQGGQIPARIGYNTGGMVGFGVVPGVGSSDTVPADLPAGSFVIRQSSSRKIGYGNLHALAGRQGFAGGGSVGTVPAALTPGEFVFSPAQTQRIGARNLQRFNDGGQPHTLRSPLTRILSGGQGVVSGGSFDAEELVRLMSTDNLAPIDLPGRVSQVRPRTVGERLGVRRYTHQGDTLVNSFLRTGKVPQHPFYPGLTQEELEEYIHLLDGSLNAGVVTSDKPLYRGVSSLDFLRRALGRDPLHKSAVGFDFSDPGYLSTSSDIDVAADFANKELGLDSAIFEIIPRVGKNALSLHRPSASFHQEDEVLLPRAQKFSIVGHRASRSHGTFGIPLPTIIAEQLARGGRVGFNNGGSITPVGWGSIDGGDQASLDEGVVRKFLREIGQNFDLDAAQYRSGLSFMKVMEEYQKATGSPARGVYGLESRHDTAGKLGLSPFVVRAFSGNDPNELLQAQSSGGSVGSPMVPATLTPGEFVFSPREARAIGYPALTRMNRGGLLNTPRHPPAPFSSALRLIGTQISPAEHDEILPVSAAYTGYPQLVRQLRPISRAEAKAFHAYSYLNNYIANNAARGDFASGDAKHVATSDLQSFLRLLDVGIASSRVVKEPALPVYRGLQSTAHIEQMLGVSLTSPRAVGRVFQESGYTSTSTGRMVAEAFADPNALSILEILLKPNSAAVYLGNGRKEVELSKHFDEAEVLLPRNQRFQVLGVTPERTLRVVQLASGGPVGWDSIDGDGSPLDEGLVRKFLREIGQNFDLDAAQYRPGLSFVKVMEDYEKSSGRTARGVYGLESRHDTTGKLGLSPFVVRAFSGSDPHELLQAQYTAAHELGHSLDFASMLDLPNMVRSPVLGNIAQAHRSLTRRFLPLERRRWESVGQPMPADDDYLSNAELIADAFGLAATGIGRFHPLGFGDDDFDPELASGLVRISDMMRGPGLDFLRQRLGRFDGRRQYADGGQAPRTFGQRMKSFGLELMSVFGLLTGDSQNTDQMEFLERARQDAMRARGQEVRRDEVRGYAGGGLLGGLDEGLLADFGVLRDIVPAEPLRPKRPAQTVPTVAPLGWGSLGGETETEAPFPRLPANPAAAAFLEQFAAANFPEARVPTVPSRRFPAGPDHPLVRKFGVSELLKLAGVLPGSVATMSSFHPSQLELAWTLEHGGDARTRSSRVIREGGDGSLVVGNSILRSGAPGVGTSVYLRQLDALVRHGATAELTAAGDHREKKDGDWSGYYVWPSKFGVDGVIPPEVRRRLLYHDPELVKGLPRSATVQQLLRIPGGEALWERAGGQFDGVLDPNSPRVLELATGHLEKILSGKRQKFAGGGLLDDAVLAPLEKDVAQALRHKQGSPRQLLSGLFQKSKLRLHLAESGAFDALLDQMGLPVGQLDQFGDSGVVVQPGGLMDTHTRSIVMRGGEDPEEMAAVLHTLGLQGMAQAIGKRRPSLLSALRPAILRNARPLLGMGPDDSHARVLDALLAHHTGLYLSDDTDISPTGQDDLDSHGRDIVEALMMAVDANHPVSGKIPTTQKLPLSEIRKFARQEVKFAGGGSARSAQPEIPALLTPDEYVFSPSASKKIGYSNLEYMNQFGDIPPQLLDQNGKVRRYHSGGRVQMSGGDEVQPQRYLQPEDLLGKSSDPTVAAVVMRVMRQMENLVARRVGRHSGALSPSDIAAEAMTRVIQEVRDGEYNADTMANVKDPQRRFEAYLRSRAKFMAGDSVKSLMRRGESRELTDDVVSREADPADTAQQQQEMERINAISRRLTRRGDVAGLGADELAQMDNKQAQKLLGNKEVRKRLVAEAKKFNIDTKKRPALQIYRDVMAAAANGTEAVRNTTQTLAEPAPSVSPTEPADPAIAARLAQQPGQTSERARSMIERMRQKQAGALPQSPQAQSEKEIAQAQTEVVQQTVAETTKEVIKAVKRIRKAKPVQIQVPTPPDVAEETGVPRRPLNPAEFARFRHRNRMEGGSLVLSEGARVPSIGSLPDEPVFTPLQQALLAIRANPGPVANRGVLVAGGTYGATVASIDAAQTAAKQPKRGASSAAVRSAPTTMLVSRTATALRPAPPIVPPSLPQRSEALLEKMEQRKADRRSRVRRQSSTLVLPGSKQSMPVLQPGETVDIPLSDEVGSLTDLHKELELLPSSLLGERRKAQRNRARARAERLAAQATAEKLAANEFAADWDSISAASIDALPIRKTSILKPSTSLTNEFSSAELMKFQEEWDRTAAEDLNNVTSPTKLRTTKLRPAPATIIKPPPSPPRSAATTLLVPTPAPRPGKTTIIAPTPPSPPSPPRSRTTILKPLPSKWKRYRNIDNEEFEDDDVFYNTYPDHPGRFGRLPPPGYRPDTRPEFVEDDTGRHPMLDADGRPMTKRGATRRVRHVAERTLAVGLPRTDDEVRDLRKASRFIPGGADLVSSTQDTIERAAADSLPGGPTDPKSYREMRRRRREIERQEAAINRIVERMTREAAEAGNKVDPEKLRGRALAEMRKSGRSSPAEMSARRRRQSGQDLTNSDPLQVKQAVLKAIEQGQAGDDLIEYARTVLTPVQRKQVETAWQAAGGGPVAGGPKSLKGRSTFDQVVNRMAASDSREAKLAARNGGQLSATTREELRAQAVGRAQDQAVDDLVQAQKNLLRSLNKNLSSVEAERMAREQVENALAKEQEAIALNAQRAEQTKQTNKERAKRGLAPLPMPAEAAVPQAVATNEQGESIGLADTVAQARADGKAIPGASGGGWWENLKYWLRRRTRGIGNAVTDMYSRSAEFAQRYNTGQASFAASFALPMAGAGVQSAAGDAEIIARSGSPRNELGYVGMNAVGGALVGAGTGAAVGNAIMPGYGAPIGLIIGAVTGWVSAIRQATSALNEAKLGLAINRISDRLSALANMSAFSSLANSGQAPLVPQYKREIVQDVAKFDTTIAEQAWLNSGTFWSSTENAIATVDKGNRNYFGQMLPGIQTYLGGEITRILRDNPDMPLVDENGRSGVLTTLRSDPFSQQMIDLIARAKQITPDVAANELRSVVVSRANALKIEQSQKDAQAQEASRVTAFTLLVRSVDAASAAIGKLKASAANLQDIFDGNYLAASRVDLNTQSLDRISSGDANGLRLLDMIANMGGIEGRSMATSGRAAAAVEEALPFVLARVSQNTFSENEQGQLDFTSQVEMLLRQAVGGGVEQQRIINSVIASINERMTGERKVSGVLNEVGGDVSGFARQMVQRSLAPVQQFGKEFTERISAYSVDISERFAQGRRNEVGILEGEDRLRETEASGVRLRAEALGEQSLTRTTALARIPLADLLRPYTERQTDLARRGGLQANAAFDPDAIAQRLRQTQTSLLDAESRQRDAILSGDPTGQAFMKAAKEVDQLRSQANSLTLALKGLADASSRLQVIQEKLSFVRADRDARLSFGQQYLGMDYGQKAEFNRGLLLARQSFGRGNVDGLMPQDASLVFSTLRQLGNAKLAGFNGQTANEIADQLVNNSAGGAFGLDPGSKAEETELTRQLLEQQRIAVEAQRKTLDLQKESQQKLLDGLEKLPKAFADALLEANRQADIKRAENDVVSARTAEAARRPLLQARERLIGAGLDTDEKVRLLNSNLPQFQEYFGEVEKQRQGSQRYTDAEARVRERLEASTKEGADRRLTARQVSESFLPYGNRLGGDPAAQFRQLEAMLAPLTEKDRAATINRFHQYDRWDWTQTAESKAASLRSALADARQRGEFGEENGARERLEFLRNRLEKQMPGVDVGRLVELQQKTPDYITGALQTLSQSGKTFQQISEEAARADIALRQLVARLRELSPGSLQVGGGARPRLLTGGVTGESVAPADGEVANGRFRVPNGGVVAGGFATGGVVGMHPGRPRGTDTIPAWLSAGEFVVRTVPAQANRGLLERINAANGPVYLAGGGFPDWLDWLTDAGEAELDAVGARHRLEERGLVPRGAEFPTWRFPWQQRRGPERLQEMPNPILNAPPGRRRNLAWEEMEFRGRLAPFSDSGLNLLAGPGFNRDRFGAAQARWSMQNLLQRQMLAQSQNPLGGFGLAKAGMSSQVGLMERGLQQRQSDENASLRRNLGAYWASQAFRAKDLGGAQWVGFRNENSDFLSRVPSVFQRFMQGRGFASGGLVPSYLAMGGLPGPDNVPIYAQAGEYILPKRTVDRVGTAALDGLRSGSAGITAPSGVTASGLNPEVAKAIEASSRSMEAAMKMFQASVGTLQAAIMSFSANSGELAKALASFEGKLQVSGTQSVNVNLNGAEVLSRLMPDLVKMVNDAVRAQLSKVFKQVLPDVQLPEG